MSAMRTPLRVACVLGSGSLAVAAIVVAWPDNGLDRGITRAVQSVRGLDSVMAAASGFGRGVIDILAPGLAIALLVVARARRAAVCLAASTIGATILNHACKWLVARPRPGGDVRVLEAVTGSSFPSGHVTEYVALFGFLAVLVAARIVRPWLRRGLLVLLVGAIAAVGPARVYLGVHWATDVIGGYLLAGAWLGVVTWAYQRRVKSL